VESKSLLPSLYKREEFAFLEKRSRGYLKIFPNIIDDLVKSLKIHFSVIPAKAGLQYF